MQRSCSGEPDGGWRKSRYSNPSGNCVELSHRQLPAADLVDPSDAPPGEVTAGMTGAS
jgi:hypothetical protein